MKPTTLQKIHNFGRAGHFICKIGQIVLIIAAVANLAGGIFLCTLSRDSVTIDLTTDCRATVYLNGDDSLEDISELIDLDIASGSIELAGVTYQITNSDANDALTHTFYLTDLKWVLFAGVLACTVLYVVMILATKLFAHFKSCESPFTEEVSHGLTRLAVSLIPATVLGGLMESLFTSAVTGAWNIELGVELTTVLLILFVFMLSAIFRYGAALQRESDETL